MTSRDRTVPLILPDQDSNEIQDVYRRVADLVNDYNMQGKCTITFVQFDLRGGNFGGNQRDYRGCYVARERVDLNG